MKLILIRHGESERNAEVYQGGKNKLTAKGREQAKRLGKYLLTEKVKAIYCSPSTRCLETMDEILRVRNDEMDIHLSLLLRPKKKGEEYRQVQKRIKVFLDDLKYELGDRETVMIISHNLAIRMIIYELLGEEVRIDNASISRLEYDGIKAKKGKINDTSINSVLRD